MAVIRFISKTIIGLVFTFSGFVKCLDPLGTAYKFEDYFLAYGLDSLLWLALPGAILMCAIELSIGLMLILSIKVPLASWMALIFMAVFTPLTLVLALTNPVTDCGCFGDALVLTNWQTFYKNLIIDVFLVILFLGRKKFREPFKGRNALLATMAVFLLAIGFEIYSLNRLPILDFRPYKIGVNIPESMVIPDDAQQPVFETTLVYEKDGVEKEFTVENYPKGDDWKWVRTDNVVIEKGYEPPIHDFSIILEDGDFTDLVLADKNYVFLLIAHDLKKASRKNQEELNKLASSLRSSGYQFICLTSSTGYIEEYKNETGAPFVFGSADQTTLKTIVRSNPGLVMLKEGTIIDKWHHRNLPDPDELLEKINSSSY